MPAKGYLISKNLLDKIRRTNERVRTTPLGSGTAFIGTGGQGRYLVEITGRYTGSNFTVDNNVFYSGKQVYLDSSAADIVDLPNGLVFGVDADSESLPPILDLTMANYDYNDARDAARVRMAVGTVVEVFATVTANDVLLYATYGAKAHEYENDPSYPANSSLTFDSEGPEAAMTDSGWPSVAIPDGFVITLQTRTFYGHDSLQDRVLYGYYRDFTYNALGVLLSMSPERRQVIDTPEAC